MHFSICKVGLSSHELQWQSISSYRIEDTVEYFTTCILKPDLASVHSDTDLTLLFICKSDQYRTLVVTFWLQGVCFNSSLISRIDYSLALICYLRLFSVDSSVFNLPGSCSTPWRVSCLILRPSYSSLRYLSSLLSLLIWLELIVY